jgi:hypothetical protein
MLNFYSKLVKLYPKVIAMRNAVLSYPYYLSLYDAQKLPYISTELWERLI